MPDRVVEMADRNGLVAVGQRNFKDAHLIFSADMGVDGNPQRHPQLSLSLPPLAAVGSR